MPDATSTNELRALNRLAFDELGGIPRGIGQIHQGIAQRAFWAVGPMGRPVKLAHDAMSRRVYSALGASSSLLGRAADAAMARRRVGEHLALSTTRPGSAMLGALHGLIGDELERDGSALHQPAAVRLDGEPVPLDPQSVHRSFPDATPWPVVFLHGLMETEFSWSLGAGPDRSVRGTAVDGHVTEP